MFGFPNETMDDWVHDIEHALSLQPEHVSAYGLMYEEGTPLYRMLEQGKVSEIDEELSIKMYDTLIDRLTAAGYEHYEISNFARLTDDDKARHRSSSFGSRHNSSYWHDIPYVGLGAAAHSYDGHSRHWAVADLKQYITAIESGRLPYTEEPIDESTHYTTTTLSPQPCAHTKALTSTGSRLPTVLISSRKPSPTSTSRCWPSPAITSISPAKASC